MEKAIIVGILALLLGAIALLIGWMGYGGFMFGIPAILLAIYPYRKGHKWLGIFAIIFSCIGIAESFVMMGIVVPAVEKMVKPELVTAKIGEPVKIDGLALTVNDVKTTKWVVGRYFGEDRSFPSKEGYKFVMLFVVVNNTGVKSEMINIWNVTITTDKGYIYKKLSSGDIFRYEKSRQPTELELREYNCSPIEEWKEIPPGEWTEGCYFFEIKEDNEPAMFNFQTEVIGGKIVSIDLTKTK